MTCNHPRHVLLLSLGLALLTASACSDDGTSDTGNESSETSTTKGDGDGDPTGDGDGDPTGDGDGDPTGDGDGDPTGDGDGDPAASCPELGADECQADGNCDAIWGVPYEEWMGGWCLADYDVFLGCISIDDACDYGGAGCSVDDPNLIYSMSGCVPGISPCDDPEPITEGCGG